MSLSENKVVLDVRPHLREKNDPFKVIMDAVNSLGNRDVLELHATIKPTPLLGIMKLKGFSNEVEKLSDDHWVVTFTRKNKSGKIEAVYEVASDNEPAACESRIFTLDNRGLEPPQPMVRTLKQLEQMVPGDKLIITNDRVPVFLLEELKQLGYQYDVQQLADDTARVTIQK